MSPPVPVCLRCSARPGASSLEETRRPGWREEGPELQFANLGSINKGASWELSGDSDAKLQGRQMFSASHAQSLLLT
jgi:hypothetical protein